MRSMHNGSTMHKQKSIKTKCWLLSFLNCAYNWCLEVLVINKGVTSITHPLTCQGLNVGKKRISLTFKPYSQCLKIRVHLHIFYEKKS